MKHITFILLFVLCVSELSFAQLSEPRYCIGGFLGLTQNLGTYGPREKTEVSDVNIVRPTAKTFGFSFDLKPTRKYFIGIEFAYDEFEGGYHASPHEQIGGLTSGLLSTDARYAIYKAGMRLGYAVRIFDQLFGNLILNPSIAYSGYVNDDTARENNYYWQTNSSRILYLRYPRYQNVGLHFVIKSTAELQYKFRNNVSLTLDAAYQQGFCPFIIDTVNIVRLYEPNAPQHKYWTRFSGTSFQFHFGIKYDF